MTAPGRRPAPRTVLAALAVIAVSALGLAGCASADDDSTADATPSTSTTPTGTSPSATPSDGATAGGVDIPVTFDGDSVTPNGERVDVPVGQDVTLTVTADAAGEIHVHSTPEQELEYDAGTTTLTIRDLDQPGVVEVESHALDKVIVQLEVQ